jgi:hypothetical protein
MAVHRLPLGGEHRQSEIRPATLRCRRCGIVIGYGDRCDFCLDRPDDHVDAPGEHMGRRHTEWIPTVEVLIADHDVDTAEFLLWRLVEATEAETLLTGVAPVEQYFRRLGYLARQRGDDTLAERLRARYKACCATASRVGGDAAG